MNFIFILLLFWRIMKISEFEKRTGIRLEDLKEENFIKILQNPEYNELFSDKNSLMDLLDEILNRNQDIEFKKELNSVKVMLQLSIDEEIIDNLFKRYRNNEITREKLLETMKIYRTSTDPIFVLSVFICSLIALKDVDLREEKAILIDSIEKIKLIFNDLGKIENSYQVRADLIDLLYTVRTKFFIEYEDELDISWVDDETDKLDQFTFEFLKNRELPEVNIKPEELGFIDITKLKKE